MFVIFALTGGIAPGFIIGGEDTKMTSSHKVLIVTGKEGIG